MGTKVSASAVLSAPRSLVRAVLLEPGSFPAWNPAFRALAGNGPGAVGQRYALSVRPGLAGWLWYVAIESGLIVTRWEVPGFAELGTWQLMQQSQGTRIIHEFEHTGLLAAALAPAYRGVAQLRLDRLDDYLRSSQDKTQGRRDATPAATAQVDAFDD